MLQEAARFVWTFLASHPIGAAITGLVTFVSTVLTIIEKLRNLRAKSKPSTPAPTPADVTEIKVKPFELPQHPSRSGLGNVGLAAGLGAAGGVILATALNHGSDTHAAAADVAQSLSDHADVATALADSHEITAHSGGIVDAIGDILSSL